MRNSLLFLTVGAIVALLIVVSAVAVWQSEQAMHQIQPLQPSPSQARPEPTPATDAATNLSPDTTATWKTYRNEKYGFELKYPPSLFLQYEATEKDILDGLISYDSQRDRHITLVDWGDVPLGTGYAERYRGSNHARIPHRIGKIQAIGVTSPSISAYWS
jgi:hypothetical protein